MTSYHGPYSSDHDDVPTRHAAEEWRNDPQRREAARARLAEIADAFNEAHDLLRRANKAFAVVGILDPNEDAIAERCQSALRLALIRFDGDALSVTEEPTDTYIGNKAAFGYAMKG